MPKIHRKIQEWIDPQVAALGDWSRRRKNSEQTQTSAEWIGEILKSKIIFNTCSTLQEVLLWKDHERDRRGIQSDEKLTAAEFAKKESEALLHWAASARVTGDDILALFQNREESYIPDSVRIAELPKGNYPEPIEIPSSTADLFVGAAAELAKETFPEIPSSTVTKAIAAMLVGTTVAVACKIFMP